LFFSCCDNVAAHFKHAAPRKLCVPQAQATCWNLRRQHREATAAGIGLGTTAKCIQQTTSGTAGNGLHTTIKYMHGAAGVGLGTTIKYLRRTTSAAANNGQSDTAKCLAN
jgi:hypothetical protein